MKKIILPLTLLTALAVSSCNESDSAKKTENPRDEELTALTERLGKLSSQLAQAEEALEAERGIRTEALSSLQTSVDGLKEELTKKESPLVVTMPVEEQEAPIALEESPEAAFENIINTRAQAVGEKYERLQTNSGREYHDVRITQVTDIGVRISHRNGAARIEFVDLPGAWHDRFFYDPERASNALKNERMARLSYEESIKKSLAVKHENERKLAKIRRDEEHALAMAEANRPVTIARVEKRHERPRGNSVYLANTNPFYGYRSYRYRNNNRNGSRFGSGYYCPPVVRPVTVRPTTFRPPVVRPRPTAPVRPSIQRPRTGSVYLR